MMAMTFSRTVQGVSIVSHGGGGMENLPADNIWIVDNSNYYTSDNVEGALQEIGGMKVGSETVSRDIYVDNILGSDTNDGSSWGAAFKTIPAAMDSISYVIEDGVTITVRCRGTFAGLATPDGEGPTVIISKICFGTGIVEVLPEDYLREGVPKPGGTDPAGWWIDFIATTGSNEHGTETGCWDNCTLFFVGPEGEAVGQVRTIVSSVKTGDTMRVTFDDNLDPVITGGLEWRNGFNIVGKAILHPGGWIGFSVDGALTKARIDGWIIEDFDGEASAVNTINGAYLRSQAMLVRDFIGGERADFQADSNSNMWVTEILCTSHEVARSSVKLDRASATIGNFVSLRDGGDVDSVHFFITNCATLNNWGGTYSAGGSANFWVNQNSVAFIGSPRGVDGADWGIYAELGGMVQVTDSSLSTDADAASFAYIQEV